MPIDNEIKKSDAFGFQFDKEKILMIYAHVKEENVGKQEVNETEVEDIKKIAISPQSLFKITNELIDLGKKYQKEHGVNIGFPE